MTPGDYNESDVSRPRIAGFTLIEVLISMVLLLAIGGMIVAALARMKRASAMETARTNLQMEARLAMETITSLIRQAGTGIGGYQIPIPYAAPWEIAINANVDDWQSPTTVLVALNPGYAFPGFDEDYADGAPDNVSPACTGSSARYHYYCKDTRPDLRFVTPDAMESRAETIRITLDARKNSTTQPYRVNDYDKGSQARAEVARSPNPSDYAIAMIRYGCDFTNCTPPYAGSTCCGEEQGAGNRLFIGTVHAWTEPDDTFPNGVIPAPLFAYYISEDRLAASIAWVRTVDRAEAQALADVNADGDTKDVFLWGDDGSGGEVAGDFLLGPGELENLYRDDGRDSIGLPVGFVNDDGSCGDARFDYLMVEPNYHPTWLSGAISRVRVTVLAESGNEVPGYNNPQWDADPTDGDDYGYLSETLVQEVAIRVNLPMRD